MTEVISIRFKHGSKTYYFAPNGVSAVADDALVVETAQGPELVQCSMGNHQVPDGEVVQPLRPVLRKATEADLRAAQTVKKREAEAFDVCQKKIAEHKLDMKLVRVESNFEGSKIIFFFTADGRVDFRELVKDLAFVFRARIELRQIGVRDEAKMLGGLGICGQPFCCSRFLDDFIPVSIKMAKTQNLSLNPTKISGTCGRLMCCLKYEQDAYEDAVKRMPKSDSFVQTPDGLGNVSGLDLLREKVAVRLDNTNDGPRRYAIEEVRVLRSGKGSRDGVDIPGDLPRRKSTAAEPQVEAPRSFFPPLEQLEPTQPPEREEGEKRRRRRGGRGRSGKGEGAVRQESAPQQKPAEPKPAEHKPQPPKSQDAAVGAGEGKSRSSRRRNRGTDKSRPKPLEGKAGTPIHPQPPKPQPIEQAKPAGDKPSGEGSKRRRNRGGRRRGNGGGAPSQEE